MELAIVIITGYLQGDRPHPGIGLEILRDKLRERYPNGREHFIARRVWDARGQLRLDARDIRRLKPRRVIVVPYSWGAGYGLRQFMEEAERIGLPVHRVCVIDGVPYVWGRWWSQAVLSHGKRLVVSGHAQRVEVFRTENWLGYDCPFGRAVDHRNVVHNTVFGRDLEPYESAELTLIRDSAVTHSTIDNDQRVHDRILDSVELELASDERTM